jgi:hypothetical protein
MALLPLEILCEKYNLNLASIKSLKHQGTLPPAAFYKDTKNVYAKEEYFARRIAFFHRCVEISQCMTYLLEEHFTQSDISREILKHNNVEVTHSNIVTMNGLLRGGLFASYDGVYLLTVNKLMWYTARYAWAIERRLKRRGTSIQEVLDKRSYDE